MMPRALKYSASASRARSTLSVPIDGGPPVANDPSPIEATWQRWNDYGIGLFLEGATKGGQKGELKQAEAVFAFHNRMPPRSESHYLITNTCRE